MMIGGLTPAYLGAHLQLLTVLLGFGAGALPLAAWVDPNSYPTAAHFVAAGVVAALLLAGAWAGPASARRRLAACVLVLLGIYGLIAVARSMLVGWVGLWPLGRSLRFHYAAGAMLVAAGAVATGMCLARWQPPARIRQVLFAVTLAGVTWMAFGLARPLNHFDGDRAETTRVLTEIRNAVAAAPPGATVEIPNRQFGAVGFLNVGYRDRFPGTAGVLAIFYRDDVVDGRRVVFTSDDALVLKGRRAGRRSPTLLRELPAPPAADK